MWRGSVRDTFDTAVPGKHSKGEKSQADYNQMKTGKKLQKAV